MLNVERWMFGGERCRRSRSGIALVITLILLSVITFLAVTFLALARREKGQVSTTRDQTSADLAASTALERAKAEINALIISTTNAFNFDLLVSTNFINWTGFDPAAVDGRTNVNYDYTTAGVRLNGNQALQNIANLLYSARPPVFVTNRLAPPFGSNEFRFYVDLNRDGAYNTNGYWPVINRNGGYYDTNGNEIVAIIPGNTLSNYFRGDPEWLGILERADFPHSSTNKFVARYAFIVIPAGKTLDLNFVHNHAKPTPPAQEGFYRNMGPGSWENNFAAFLRDLNTNAWNTYSYSTNRSVPSLGVTFEDARSITRYRYNGNQATYLPMVSVFGMFNAAGETSFQSDFVDGYSAGPLLVDYRGWNYQIFTDADGPLTRRPWPGADNPFHFFTTQDLFDRAKVGYGAGAGTFTLAERLYLAQTNSQSSYDRDTFYRLLSQVGTDSAPDDDSKLNVNYVSIGGLKSTNFISWTDPDLVAGNAARGIPRFDRPGSELFFVNAADRLLKRYSAEWQSRNATDYLNVFGTNQTFGVTNIPVLVNGRFTYTPALHRLLQLTANIWDSVNPSWASVKGDKRPDLPTVFRPVFTNIANNIYITDFVEQGDFVPSTEIAYPNTSQQLIDLSLTNAASLVQPLSLILGVPMVVGVKKGLPNFNEFAAESVVQITRKLELIKSGPGGGNMINQTNQIFTIGISNAFGAEFWNSYPSNYTRGVDMAVINFSLLALTNDYGYLHRSNLTATGLMPISPSPGWPRYTERQSGRDASLLVPLRTNHVIVADSVYSQVDNNFHRLDYKDAPGNYPQSLPLPRWGLALTNRVVAYIRDQATGRLIDFVQLTSLAGFRDVTSEMAQPKTAADFDGLWATNALPSATAGLRDLTDRPGVINQIQISKGDDSQGGRGDWKSFGYAKADDTKFQEIAIFKAFFNDNHQATVHSDSGNVYTVENTNLVATAPFSPTWKQSVALLWQANDPLVHYTAGDMEFLERSGVSYPWRPSNPNSPVTSNLGKVNERYLPWGGNPFAGSGAATTAAKNDYNPVVKDPGVKSSSFWQFPTNKLATLGWLGRIHRGTPWQTVYLKSTSVSNAIVAGAMKPEDWSQWAGNRNLFDAVSTQPETDRGLFDVFTTTLNENASRGQLPINQTNLAAWSAVFGGMLALTNSVEDAKMDQGFPPQFDPLFIEPAGIYDAFNPSNYPAVVKLVQGINRTRNDTNLYPQQTFKRLGDILTVPELTMASPFLNTRTPKQRNDGLNDAVYEWLPQQMLSLVKLGEPRFVVYAYGQALKPADKSVVLSGPYFGMATNYQVTAEVVMRAVMRIEGAPNTPHAVMESFTVLPPD